MPVAITEREAPKNRKDQPADGPLNPLEAEVIAFFVQLCRALGLPRSLAEIYGLLFISVRPLALDDLIERLGLSKGSASQGLKFLRNAGAIGMVYVPGDRRVHYEAVAELRKLASRFLSVQIAPHLDNGRNRLEHIAEMVRQLPAEERGRVSTRVTMLQNWERKGRKFLPMMVKVLEG